jgi:hypothetical protein
MNPPTSEAMKPSQYEPVCSVMLNGHVGRGRRDGALGEVDDPRRPPDQHQGQGEGRVHRTLR